MIRLEFNCLMTILWLISTKILLILTRIMNNIPIWIASKRTLVAEFLFTNRAHFHFSQELTLRL